MLLQYPDFKYYGALPIDFNKSKKKNDSETKNGKNDSKKTEKKNQSITDKKNQVKSKKDGKNE